MQLKNYNSETDFLKDVESFARSYLKNHAQEIDIKGKIPTDITTELAERRLFAFDRLKDSDSPLDSKKRYELIIKVIQMLAHISASTSKMVLDQNLGQVPMFIEYASEELKSKYIPKIQSGESQMAFLMTEPQTGSVLSKFQCTGKRSNGGFLLNGSKDWITGAETRSLFLVVAKSETNEKYFGLFFIDRTNKQFNQSIQISARKEQLGLRGLGEHLVKFTDTFVPENHVIIPFGESTISKIMKHYSRKRCGQAAIAIGLSKSALNFSYNYLKERHPGREGRLAFQNAEFTCANMYSLIQASEQLTEWAVAKVIDGDKTGVPCCIAKLFATEVAVKITNSAIQLCGANATSQELPLERFMRDARMLTIVGGTSEIQKRTIAKALPNLLEVDKNWYNILGYN